MFCRPTQPRISLWLDGRGSHREDIKNKVDYITLSNDEDGVALFLESLL